jgi:hypothetical protein
MVSLFNLIVKPWWYEMNDYSKKPRMITMVIGFATVVTAFLVFSTVMFWGTVAGWIILIPAALLVSAAVAFISVRILISLWRNIPYRIEVWRTEREVNSIEIIEFHPAQKRWWSFISENWWKVKVAIQPYLKPNPMRKLPRNRKK